VVVRVDNPTIKIMDQILQVVLVEVQEHVTVMVLPDGHQLNQVMLDGHHMEILVAAHLIVMLAVVVVVEQALQVQMLQDQIIIHLEEQVVLV
jgi:hypothetical protein